MSREYFTEQDRKTTFRYESAHEVLTRRNALKDKVRCAACGAVYQLVKSGDDEWYLEAYADDTIRNCHPVEIGKRDFAEMVNRDAQFVDFGMDYLPEYIEEILIRGWAVCVRMKPMSPEQKNKLLLLQDYWLAQQGYAGNEQAKEILYFQYTSQVRIMAFHFGRNINLNHYDLEDLEQNVWLQAFRYLNSYNGKYPFRFWLRGILKYEFLKMYAKRKRENIYDKEKQHELLIQLHAESIREMDQCQAQLNVESMLSILEEQERKIITDHLFREKSLARLSVEYDLSYYRTLRVYHKALDKMRIRILKDRY